MTDHAVNDDQPTPSPASEPERDEPVPVSTGSSEVDPASERPEIPPTLPVLPIRDAVAFPGTVVPVRIHRERSKRVLDLALAGSRLIAAVAQRSADTEDPRLDDLYRVGTACRIIKMFKTDEGEETIILHGLCRVGVANLTREEDHLEATVHAHWDSTEQTTEIQALMHIVRQQSSRLMELSPNVPDEAKLVLRNIESPGNLADFMAANLPLSTMHRQELLETFGMPERLRKVSAALAAQLEVLELSQQIQGQVRSQMDRAQREYYLREQMKAIQKELGEGDGRTELIERLRQQIKNAGMPEAVLAEAEREVDRLEGIPAASPEYSMTQDYVEWLVALPWSASTEDNLDINRAQQVLDEDHYGLDDVKRRILEFLAVRKLKADSRGPILCFAGPPGVGKTSLGRSIARALGRKFIRVSLGGIRDEATIRGHRRTYIGSMPGNVIRELRKAGSRNPLFMLDEVDKIGQDIRGDPMAALLEVLDPAQNDSFVDHYLNVPFDLSDVMFIATANYLSAIEPALRDRMEIIELSGYTHREKLHIARRHLLPRQLEENGLTPDRLALSDEVILEVISGWTREAGVRGLERQLGTICRARAAAIVRGESPSPTVAVDELDDLLGLQKHEPEVAAEVALPGVATGLAFTPVGGEILFIEAAVMPGGGGLRLTGQLGDVMRESAQAAHSMIRSRAEQWHIPLQRLLELDMHVHVPAGATPKDGPSAGLAMVCAMSSVLLGQALDPAIGMTGEITLSGRVLPIGGVREKVIAAHRAGLTRVLLPKRNEPDLQEVPEEVRAALQFTLVSTVDEVLQLMLPRPQRAAKVTKVTRKKTARRPAARKTSKVKKAKATKKKARKRPQAKARR